MAKRRTMLDAEQRARQLLAYAEERALLYREMVKLHEQLLTDLVEETIGTRNDRNLEQMSKSWSEMGTGGPQHDV